MMLRTAIAGILFFTACVTDYAGQGDQPPASGDSKDKVQPAQSPAPSPAQSKESLPKGQPAPAVKSGAMVFIDPVTRQIRQPTEAEIGALSAAATATSAANPQPAPVPALILGPGPAVGLKLGADARSYMVVTKTPDGKLVMDCVTGDPRQSSPTAGQPAKQQPPQR